MSALYQGGAGTDNYENVYLCAAVLQAIPSLWEPRYHVALFVAYDGSASLDTVQAYIVTQTHRPHHVHAFGFEGAGTELRMGGWMDGIVVTLHRRETCGKCDLQGLLNAALDIEEES